MSAIDRDIARILGRTYVLARNLADNMEVANGLAGVDVLAGDYTADIVRIIAGGRRRAIEIACEISSARKLTPARSLDHIYFRENLVDTAHEHACALADDLQSACDRARIRAEEVASGGGRYPRRVLAGGRDRDRALVRAHDLVNDLVRDSFLVGDLTRKLSEAYALLRLNDGTKNPISYRVIRVAPSADRLLEGVALLLPPADRARYSEEYHSELWEIARTRAGRRQQLQYAARQLSRAGHLRIAVRAPRRRKVTP